MSEIPKAVSDYMRQKGSKGGKATGPSKVRGGSAHYQRLSKMAAKARRKK